MSSGLCLVSMYMIWIFRSRLILSKKPIKRNSVGAGHVSQRRASAFDDHLDHRFVVLKKKKHGARTTRFCVLRNIIDIDQIQIISFSLDLGLVAGVFLIAWHGSACPELG